MDSQVSTRRWQALTADLHIPEDLETYSALRAAYGERHRHYHTLRHLDHCLAELDPARYLATEPAEVEVALWFHDAVYDPHGSSNEEASAQWAERFLRSHAAEPARIGRIREHVLATRHESPAASSDSRLVVDVDLAILGAAQDSYQAFEANVRAEYSWVPEAVFRPKRAEILQSFLDRPRIYQTVPFRDRYETAARSNLAAAISALRS